MINQNLPFYLPYRLRRIASCLFLWPVLFFAMFPMALYAQETFIQPPARLITTFPIILFTGGVTIIRGRLENFPDTLNFVLDTGSGGISLDSATCDSLKLKTEMSNRVIRGIAGVKTVAFTYNHTLHFPGLAVEKLDFHINDYYLLTSVYGIQIDGII